MINLRPLADEENKYINEAFDADNETLNKYSCILTTSEGEFFGPPVCKVLRLLNQTILYFGPIISDKAISLNIYTIKVFNERGFRVAYESRMRELFLKANEEATVHCTFWR